MALNLSRAISVAGGVGYLLRTASTADQPEAAAGGIVNYYTLAGTPAGRWLGEGARAVGLRPGEQITQSQAERLYQRLAHPLTGAPLGGANARLKAEPERLSSRTVACYDLTFSVPKSVSILFAAAPGRVQRAILAAHHEAIAQTVAWAEANVFQTRSGRHGVAVTAIRGVIAGRWDHWDSREGDPHLHSHVAVSNRVQRAWDGKWMALDGSAVYRAGVAMSELHTNLLLDGLHRRLGLDYQVRSRPESRTTRAVVADVLGVPDDLIDHFSARAAQIRDRIADFEQQWRTSHDGDPDARLAARWKNQAWRETRPRKDATHRTLAELCARWRNQITRWGHRPESVVSAAVGHPPRPVAPARVLADSETMARLAWAVLADQAAGARQPAPSDAAARALARDPGALMDAAAAEVVAQAEGRQATWSVLQLRAGAERITRLIRFASPEDRLALVDGITTNAIQQCLPVRRDRYTLAAEAADDLRVALRGRTAFDHPHLPSYTTGRIWDAEEHLIDLFARHDHPSPHVPASRARRLVQGASRAHRKLHGHGLAPDQAAAVQAVLIDPRRLAAVIGAAGTGKTTSMAALRDCWERIHGQGTVVALAPSAAAAHVLGRELGTPAATVAKWLWETSSEGGQARRDALARSGGVPAGSGSAAGWVRLVADDAAWRVRPGGLIIVDEAAMTGTLSLDQLARQAEAAGAKMLLVGDPAQLDAVEAGGMLGWAERHGHAVALTSLWRFRHEWMGPASLGLRGGRASEIGTYDEHGMVHSGDTEQMRQAAYDQALKDFKDHVPSVLVAASAAEAKDLAERASLDLRAAGIVDSTVSVAVRAGLEAGLGERILARVNDRTTTDQWGNPVNNGTFMTVTAVEGDLVTALREDTGGIVHLDRRWVADNCELGYAVTVHRTQGITVENSHFLLGADDRTTRELLYVAMTRGRESNHVYVGVLTEQEAAHLQVRADDIPTATERLSAVLRRAGAERTAHEVADQALRDGMSLERLVPEHEYLASLVAGPECLRDLRRANPAAAAGVDRCAAWPALVAAWSKARLIEPQATWDRFAAPVVGDRIDDMAALLRSRLAPIADQDPPAADDDRWVAGLVPRIASDDPGVAALAAQNEALIEARVAELAATPQPWEQALPGRPISVGPEAHDWDQARLRVAVYRDRWQVDTTDALGPAPADSELQRREWQRASQALSAQQSMPQPDENLLRAWANLHIDAQLSAAPAQSALTAPATVAASASPGAGI